MIIIITMITIIGSGDLGYAAAAKRGVYEIHPESLSIDSHSNNLINDKNGNKKISAINGTKVTSIDKDKDKIKKNIVSPLLVPISSPIINDDVVVLTQSNMNKNIVTPTSVTATATVSLESKTQTHIASKSIPLSENEKSIPINVLSQSQSLPIELNDSITFGNFETPIAYESEINISIFFFLLLSRHFLYLFFICMIFFFFFSIFSPVPDKIVSSVQFLISSHLYFSLSIFN